MPKRGTSANTRSGGQPAEMRMRQIVADPNGSREQRRAAARLAKGRHQTGAVVIRPDETTEETGR